MVKKAQYHGIPVAVKEFSEVAFDETEAQEEFDKEIQILSQISSHPNVVILVVRSRLQSAWRVMCVCHLSAFKGTTIQPRCIVMEFVENGSLLDVIRKRPEELTEVRSFTILKGVAAGMVIESHCTRLCTFASRVVMKAFLHTHDPPILHRDLKSANVLITAHWEAKITDFGISRTLSDRTMTKHMGTCMGLISLHCHTHTHTQV